MSAEVSTVSHFADISQLRGWLPVDAVIRDGQPGVIWLDLRDVEFREPFFEQTVARVRKERADLVERFTTFDAFLQLEKLSNFPQPAGFIFHSSRCGSTLVANALKVFADSCVISEPGSIDKLIGRYFTDVQDDKRRELLYSVFVRAALNLLGQHTKTTGKYFVKFAAISALQMYRLKRIWPNVPAVFVYRHPVEVMISNLEDPPQWMDIERDPRMAAAILGVPEAKVLEMSREEFCARTLGRFYLTARSMVDRSLRLLNYQQLSLDSLLALSKFLGLRIAQKEHDAIAASLRVHAKDPAGARHFVDDTERKRKSASPLVYEMAEQWAIGPYQKLEHSRIRQEVKSRRENLDN